jgi:hypothetical protein
LLTHLTRTQRSGRWSLLFLLALGCSSEDPTKPAPPSTLPTGSTCPNPSAPSVTYGGWAQNFFESYCTRCHSSALETQTDRSGATPGYNWDDLPTIKAHDQEIDAYAAGGPDGINRVMPPSDPRPSDDERVKLGEWIACGEPE